MTADAFHRIPLGERSIAAESVRVLYQGVVAVDDVSFAIGRGELCGLIGPNGSGKSTLLGVLSRLVEPNKGRILAGGRDYTHCRPADVARLGIARTFQTVRLVPTLTVIENVMLGFDGRGSGLGLVPNVVALGKGRRWEREARAYAREMLESVGLDRAGHDSAPSTLPYGLQRRVELARALASGPQILLLDEPTAGMSESERHEIGELLVKVNAGGVTVLIVEHNLALINRICTWLFVLSEGRTIAAGPPDLVSRDPVVTTAYLSTTRADHAAR